MMLFLFKAMLYSAPLFFLNFHNGFSGVSYITDLLMALFEVILTTFAVYAYLLLDQDISFKDSIPKEDQSEGYVQKFPKLLVPELYIYKIQTHLNKKTLRFGMWVTWMWISAIVMFYVPFLSMGGTGVNGDGKDGSLWASGITSFTILICVHHGSILITTRNFTWPMVAFYVFSFFCFMPLTLILNEIDPSSNTYMQVFPEIMGGTGLFWLSLIFGCGVILMPIYMAKSYEMIIKSPNFY